MKILAFTGAGISRESGLKTFRDLDGLWEGHKVEDICSVKAWNNNRKAVLDFYNERRREVRNASPNLAHKVIAALEQDHDVTIVTQNVDDLHERAGSTRVIHIHGNIMQMRGEFDPDTLLDCSEDILLGHRTDDMDQLRPHVVFFGEGLYGFGDAMQATEEAEVLLIVGTTLEVYPAAYIATDTKAKHIWLVDPNPPSLRLLKKHNRHVRSIPMAATVGVPMALSQMTRELVENG